MTYQRATTGRLGETAAASFLESRGVRILSQNFRCRLGEIDLIGIDGRYLIIVEVKTRVAGRAGSGAAAVHFRKQERICAAFRYYCMCYQVPETVPVRFDVVEVDGHFQCFWIKNAFEYR